jgi:TorA maturation chaperone TorD
LKEKLRVLLDRFGRTTLPELEEAHLRTFGASPRGRIAAYECEYGSSEIFQFANELSDIVAFYSAFGLSVGRGHERPDHISMECEFMRFLCAKEACLLADNRPDERDHLAVTREAQQRFLREHIGRWSAAFSRQLATADFDGPFGSAAELLEEFISTECRRWSIAVGPAYLPLREIPQADDPANCISCGKAEGLPGQISESDETPLDSE